MGVDAVEAPAIRRSYPADGLDIPTSPSGCRWSGGHPPPSESVLYGSCHPAWSAL